MLDYRTPNGTLFSLLLEAIILYEQTNQIEYLKEDETLENTLLFDNKIILLFKRKRIDVIEKLTKSVLTIDNKLIFEKYYVYILN